MSNHTELHRPNIALTTVCTRCGQTLRRQWNEPGTDFTWVDANGSTIGGIGDGPDAVRTKTEFLDWLLATNRMGAYSNWSARLALGSLLPWEHHHQSAHTARGPHEPPTPVCCSMPMQATRDGWLCRHYCRGRLGIIAYP
ncbi:hypothetical protein [Gordonia alkanivorans]|uniref:hypothetical protein n=1 Tax=Gordonia alkanivorans TaxID=84096 RepID=UPI0004AFC421|nr:hypothetical protein [Gordonia alkanivorans]